MKRVLLAALLLALPCMAAAPVVDKEIFGALNAQPVVALRNAANANQLSTTPVAPFTDLDAGDRTANNIQQIVILNIDTTASVCVKVVAYGVTPNSGNFDCLGTHPGLLVPAGQSRGLAFTGEVKLWVVSSEASTDVQLERAMLFAQAAR